MKSPYYVIGFICGILSVAIVSIILAKIAKKKNKNIEYDERQQAIRGQAYKTGFKAFAVCEVLAMCNEIGFGFHFMDAGLLHFTFLIISCLAFVIHAMWNDAYFQGREKKIIWIIIMLVGIIFNLVCFFWRDSSENFTEDGLMSYAFINLFCAIFCFIILVNGVIKILVDKKSEKKENQEE